MPLETGSFIDSLDVTWPLSSDPVSGGDDHIRLIKTLLLATFPNIAGAVTPTHTELNYVDGVTSGIQAQLDAITGSPGIPSGTKMLFYQASPPVGWTAVAGITDSALRVVAAATTGGASAGTNGFVTSFDAHIHSTAAHALTIAEMPAHTHDLALYSGVTDDDPPNQVSGRDNQTSTAGTHTAGATSTGGGGTHTHGNTGAPTAAIDFKYSDVIICTKD